MLRRIFISCLAAVGTLNAGGAAIAQDTIKIGLILPMTGQQTTTGKQIEAAVRLYLQQHGTTVNGKKIEVVLKDDGAVPDNTKRIAQELIVNDKVSPLAGFGVTPSAFAVASLATEAKIPMIVMAAGTSTITERSPLHCPYQFHAGANDRHHCRLGREEWRQKGRHHGQ
jgi:branched-chain amino acid transport system substrate-binding protein